MYTSIYCTSYLINEGISYIFNFFQPYLFDFIRLLIGGELDYLHILCNRAVVACYLRRYFLLLTNNAVRQL